MNPLTLLAMIRLCFLSPVDSVAGKVSTHPVAEYAAQVLDQFGVQAVVPVWGDSLGRTKPIPNRSGTADTAWIFCSDDWRPRLFTVWSKDAAGNISGPSNGTVIAAGKLAGSPSTAPSLVEYCRNGGFETDLAGWTPYHGAGVSRVRGVDSWVCHVRGLRGIETFGIDDSPAWVGNVKLGGAYRFSARVRSDSSTSPAQLQVREYRGQTKLGSTTYSPARALSGAWQEISVKVTGQADSTAFDFQVMVTPRAVGESFQVDDVSIVQEVHGAFADHDTLFWYVGTSPVNGKRVKWSWATDKPEVRMVAFDLKPGSWDLRPQWGGDAFSDQLKPLGAIVRDDVLQKLQQPECPCKGW